MPEGWVGSPLPAGPGNRRAAGGVAAAWTSDSSRQRERQPVGPDHPRPRRGRRRDRPAGRLLEAAPSSGARIGSLTLFWSDTPWPSLWSIRPDGSHRTRVFRTHQNSKRPVLSPERRWIAFDGTPPGQRPRSQFDIQVVRRDGTGRSTLVPSRNDETDPQWSPDGKRISYVRLAKADEGDWRKSWIWTVRTDGSDAKRLVLGATTRAGRRTARGSYSAHPRPTAPATCS
jgi:hypothetical protein